MKPEEKAEIILYNWLRPFVKEIYSNRKHKYLKLPIFQVDGTHDNKILDFIIETNDNKYLALEIKSSNKNSIVTEGASQMYQRYYLQYCYGNKNFIINNQQITIHSFLIATDQSINGKLFKKREYIEDNTKDNQNYHKLFAVKNKFMPKYEYSTTYQFVRTMWKTLNEDLPKIKNDFNRFSGIGILIADYESKVPYMFVKYKLKTFGIHYWRIN